MTFVCPDCSTNSLSIGVWLELPPDCRWDEIALQIVECSQCGFAGIAVYEESRRGALDTEIISHYGYRVGAADFETLEESIKQCPDPGNWRCECSVHQRLGRQGASGRWNALDDVHRGGSFELRLHDDTQTAGPVVGDSREMRSANQTQAFLADEPAWAAAKVELADVQGLWGGRRVFVSGTGRVVVQVVSPGKRERRYEFVLGRIEIRQLFWVCIENDLVTIKCQERLGIPDEARPAITLVNAAGDRCVVSKWAGVKDERFDAVYAELLRIEALTSHLVPIYSGPFSSDYVPGGF